MYGIVPDDDVAAIVDCVERGVKEVVGTLIVQFGSFRKSSFSRAGYLRRDDRALQEDGEIIIKQIKSEEQFSHVV